MIRDWTDSLRMDGLSAEAERLFMRIIMKADDYGRFHGEPRLLKAACFPLADSVLSSQIPPWISELSAKGLVVEYEADGRKLLAIPNYGQRLRTSRAKFLPMPGEPVDWLPHFGSLQPPADNCPQLADNCPQLPATSRNFPPEGKGSGREAEYETETETEHPPSPQGDFRLVADAIEILNHQVLPKDWRRLTTVERQRVKVLSTNETMTEIGSWFGRKPGTFWTVSEYLALDQLNPTSEEVEEMGRFYSIEIEKNGYRKTALGTLLNNWNDELDKGRNYFANLPK